MNRETSNESAKADTEQVFGNNEIESWDIDDRLYEKWRERKWFHEVKKENKNQQ